MQEIDIASLTIEEVKNLIVEIGEKNFVENRYFIDSREKDRKLDEMTNLSKRLREKLKIIMN